MKKQINTENIISCSNNSINVKKAEQDNDNNNQGHPSSFYESYKIPKGQIEHYEVHTKIGRGRYSEVFEGLNTKTNTNVVIKILKPIKKLKIKREAKILSYLKECPNIIQLSDIVKDPATRTYCLIYDSIEAKEMKKISFGMKDEDLRFYMYKIIQCLEYSHSHQIIHRDIKPGNIVINQKTKELRVIDWGLAEYYVKGFKYNVRVSSRYYKAPELLLNYMEYDYAIDMWSLGCLFAGVLFQRDYFFKGDDLFDQLVRISKVLGSEGIEEFIKKYPGSSIDEKTKKKIQNIQKMPFWNYVSERNKYLVNEDAIDLLSKLLMYDPEKRITAKEALMHPYFKKFNSSDNNHSTTISFSKNEAK